VGDQCLPNLLKERVHAAGLNGVERDPVTAWGAVVGLGESIGFAECIPLADMDV
jgi:hypothetical protein